MSDLTREETQRSLQAWTVIRQLQGETIHIVAILRDPKDGCHVSALPKACPLSHMTPFIDTERREVSRCVSQFKTCNCINHTSLPEVTRLTYTALDAFCRRSPSGWRRVDLSGGRMCGEAAIFYVAGRRNNRPLTNPWRRGLPASHWRCQCCCDTPST